MHGADWPAMRTKYAAFLPHLAHARRPRTASSSGCRANSPSATHTRRRRRCATARPRTVPGGLLGADYEVANGRYRFTKVYGGLNWNSDAARAADRAGRGREGRRVPARGQRHGPAAADERLRAVREHRRQVDRDHRRAERRRHRARAPCTVVPIASEAALRNRDWVEGNLRKVTEATNGRVAYVYVPEHGRRRAHVLQALLLPADQPRRRSSSTSGSTAAGRSPTTTSTSCAGRSSATGRRATAQTIRTPAAAILGPKVMIIDETAGSGGDLLPWMFRKFKLGPLVGKRTWGGLVGILGFPVLMDGGTVTAPNLAIWHRGRAGSSRTRACRRTSRSSRRRPT